MARLALAVLVLAVAGCGGTENAAVSCDSEGAMWCNGNRTALVMCGREVDSNLLVEASEVCPEGTVCGACFSGMYPCCRMP